MKPESDSVAEDRRLDVLLAGAFVPGDTGVSMDVKPSWFDEDLYQKGRAVGYEYGCGTMLSTTIGAVMMSQYKNLMEPLVASGNMGTVEASRKRVANTFQHALTWVVGNVWEKENMGYKSLRQIRNIHLNVAKRMTKERPKQTAEGVWLSQLDMALTQFSIIGPAILYSKQLGYYATDEEMDAIVFLWRCIGHQLGMEDQYNLCRGTYKEVRQLCEDIVEHIVKPTLLNPSEYFAEILENAHTALKSFSLFVDHNMFVNFTFELMGLPAPLSLSHYGRFCDHAVKRNVTFMRIGPFRRAFTPWYRAKVNQWVQEYRQKLQRERLAKERDLKHETNHNNNTRMNNYIKAN